MQTTGIETDFLSPGARLPIVVKPVDSRDFHSLNRSINEVVKAYLAIYGAILFRGFPIYSASLFEQFIRMLSPDLLNYEFGSTPRSQVQNQIYTSTEYPAHQHIPLHNKKVYTLEWPMKIWFYCDKASQEGGETPIADSREVLKRIDPRIRERFIHKKVMYVRNYGNGLDVPWQKVFGTADRSAVEVYCRNHGIIFEWKENGELRVRQVCQAVAVHPQTGEMVWFNQVHLFHVSNLEPHVRDALLAAVSEENLPRNAYYEDGTPIETSILDEIRQAYQGVAVQFPWQQGDVLMLDNMLVAHGRAPYKGGRKILVAMAEPYCEK